VAAGLSGGVDSTFLLKAAVVYRVCSPLMEIGLTKADIRSMSRELNLPTADVPASPCLASRIIYGLEINESRLSQVDNILAGNSYGQEAVKSAVNAIQIWQGIVRDLLLIEFSQDNLIQNQPISQELKQIKNKFSLNGLLKLNQDFKQAIEYLNANVSPKLVIENLVINI